VLLVSKHALLPVREHCRSLAEVLTPDGERRRWRWHDADVLRELLPVLQSAQLDELFALGQSVIVPTSAVLDLVRAGTRRARERDPPPDATGPVTWRC
jgi:hypothetical protein